MTQTQTRRRQPPTTRVSLYVPSGRRSWWWYAYHCPLCSRHQLGRARQLTDVAGIRRADDGHDVTVVIARVYGRAGDAR